MTQPSGASEPRRMASPPVALIGWSIDTTTSTSGKATFKTTVPKGADVCQGSATVLISTDDFGSTQDFTVITITK